MLQRLSSLLSPASKATSEQNADHGNTQTANSISQSARLESMKPRTLDQMLRCRAHLTPDQTLLWYPSTGSKFMPYTAAQINTFVDVAASHYSKKIPRRKSSSENPRVVALLGLADLSYVVTMFALYRLGHTAVLLSPRLPQEGYDYLLGLLDAHDIIYHESKSKTVANIADTNTNVQSHQIVREDMFYHGDGVSDDSENHAEFDVDIEGANIAVIIHSSGSTGLPKPSKLSHDTMVMAANKNVNMKAFTCVPFFHGFGLNGLHRGIYSGQEFFSYNASLPLTSKHLIETITKHDFEVLFCVPYALKLLAESNQGTEALKKCKLVWFAGSACPDDLGDALTEKDVRLVSDYGLSECGPLMTTMRPDDDDAWNYLRPLPHNKPYMKFEERGGGTCELVCLDGMPWKVAENRDDHSYATNDLFEKHPTIKDAWRFIARQDDTLTLSNGEKANPSIMEGKFRQHGLVAEAVMFGVGKSELGMILIKSDAAKDMSDSQMLQQIWPRVLDAQKEMPEHGRIAQSMLVVLPAGTEYPRTDKGTIIRQRFYKRFEDEIEDAYIEETEGERLDLEESALQDFVHDAITEALNLAETEVDNDTDLFSLGVDSLQSTQLRRKIQSHIDLKGNKLPINVVYENPTIHQLCKFIMDLTSGYSSEDRNPTETFSALLDQYGDFDSEMVDDNQRCVVLTGATGSLGAHSLNESIRDQTVSRVYCLVRASSHEVALERINESLQIRKLYNGLDETDRSKIVALAADLAEPHLGLDVATYRQMSLDATTVVHAAWPVNFHMSLASFRSDLVGTKNLLDLCLSPQRASPATFTFCSSISTSMKRPVEDDVPESVPSDLTTALDMGYAQSKLAAEHLCTRAAEQTGLKAYIMRIGQIVGDTEYGVWNASEAVPLMLQSAQTIGALPSIDEIHKWLPVDVVAKVVLEASLPAAAPAGMVFNIINPNGSRWKSDLLPKLRAAGLKFREVPTREWLELLRNSDQDGNINPPIKLLSYFESVYDKEDHDCRGEERVWQSDNVSKYSATFAQGWTISDAAIEKFLTYFLEDCWDRKAETSRERQASWSSERTVGDDEDTALEHADSKRNVEEDLIRKEKTREQMYADLGRKDRTNSLATLYEDDKTYDSEKLFWDNEAQKFELRDVEVPSTKKRRTRRVDQQACFVKLDMEELKSGKVIAWTGTCFELRDPRETPSQDDAPSCNDMSDSPTDDACVTDEVVIVPREGEVIWDANAHRFDVSTYIDVDRADTSSDRSMKSTMVDTGATMQSKQVFWNGSKFMCCRETFSSTIL